MRKIIASGFVVFLVWSVLILTRPDDAQAAPNTGDTDDVAECQDQGTISPNVITGLFNGLLSFFSFPFFTPTGLGSNCINQEEAFMSANFNLVEADNRYYPGKHRCGYDRIYQNVTITNLSASKNSQFPIPAFPFFDTIRNIFTSSIKMGEGLAPGHKGPTSPAIDGRAPDTRLSSTGYFGGCVGLDPDCTQKKLHYMKAETKDPAVLEELYQKDAGVFKKLSPAEKKSVTGEFKPLKDALKDRVLAAVARGWICHFLNKNCDGEQAFDMPIGQLFLVEAGPETWGDATCPSGKTCRPLMTSELFCVTGFSTPDIASADVENVCQNYLGIRPDRTLTGGGVIGRKFGTTLKTCNIDCMKINGLMDETVPEASFDDVGPRGRVKFFSAGVDPAERPDITDPTDPDYQKLTQSDQKISLPGGLRATTMWGDYVASLVSPPEVNKKRAEFREQLPNTQCVKSNIGYLVGDEIGAADYQNASQKVADNVTINAPPQVQGVTTGQVLPAVVPQASPYIGSHDIVRGGGGAMGITEVQVKGTMNFVHEDTGIANLFAPPERAAEFKEIVGGIPFYLAPSSMTVKCTGDHQCVADSALPLEGAKVILATGPGANKQPASFISQLIYPPEAIEKGANVAAMIHNLVNGITPKTLSEQIWGDLTSFGNSQVAEK